MERSILDEIEKWVKIVNKEIGREDRNEQSIEFFSRLIGVADFKVEDDYYLVTLVHSDMWGDKCLSVISCYVLPEKRTGKSFLKIQREINKLAKLKKVRYIYQGSHIDMKLLDFLGKIGYKHQTMVKEL